MSSKPSLYVVERREVVILIVLFVLVTVLAFTLGVKYGQSVGHKLAEKELQAKQTIVDEHQTETGGSLVGDAHEEASVGAEHDAGAEHKSDEHAAAVDSHKREATESHTPPPIAAKLDKAGLQDTNSDQVLLDALKEAAMEGQSAKAAVRLPEKIKTLHKAGAKAGGFVIQVGSYPTRKDAEQQLGRLQSRKIPAQILAPTRDRQGEWHRVVLGSYSNRNDAEKDAKMYKDRGLIKTYFVRKMN